MPPLTLLELDPAACLAFPSTRGGPSVARLRLTNTSGTLVAYKVKATAPKSYAIRPSAGSIRRGESAEVQIARKATEEEEPGDAAGGAGAGAGAGSAMGKEKQRKDRFLVQAAVVDSDEKKLLLHAAQRGKTVGAAKFWDSVPKESLEEQQLVATCCMLPAEPEPGPGLGPGQWQQPQPQQSQGQPAAGGPPARVGHGHRHSAGNVNANVNVNVNVTAGPGTGTGTGMGMGMPSQEAVDAILGKLSLPGRSPPAAPEPLPGPGPGGPPGLVAAAGPPGLGGLGLSSLSGLESTGRAAPVASAASAASAATVTATVAPAQQRRSSGKEDVVLQKHSRPVTFVCLAREPASGGDGEGCSGGDKEVLYSCSKDKEVLAWALPSGQLLRRYEGHRGAVWACSVSPEGALLLTCGADSAVLLWDAASGQQLAEVQMPGVVRWVEWAPPNSLGLRRFAACSNSFKSRPASLALMDFTEGPGSDGTTIESHQLLLIEEPALPSGATQVVWAGPEGCHLCSVHGSGELLFWRVTDGLLHARLIAHDGPVSQVAFPRDRSLMATCGRTDMQVKLWSLSSFSSLAGEATLLCSFLSDRPLNAVSLRPSLSLEEVLSAAAGANANSACACLVGGGQDARDVALVGAGTDDQFDPVPLRLADTGSLEPLLPPGADDRHKGSGHFGPIHTLAFSLDAGLCISGSEDGNVRLRDLTVDPSLAPTAATPAASQPQPQAQLQQTQRRQPPGPPRLPLPGNSDPGFGSGPAKRTSRRDAAAASPEQQQPQQQRGPPSRTQLPAAAVAPAEHPIWWQPPVASLRAVAIADFDPSTIGWPPTAPQRPLPLRRGQEIEITKDAGGGWSWGRAVCSPGVVGLLPSNYILPLSKYEEMLRKTFEQQKKDESLLVKVANEDMAAGQSCQQPSVGIGRQEVQDPAEEDGDCSQS